MQVPSDAELVQSAQSGDEGAFETLVKKYRIRIYAIISAFIDNPQDREDIAQETFINAYRNLHQLSKPERFGSWLDTIAQNQCRDWMRKNRGQTIPLDEVDANLLNADDSPEHASIEAEQRQMIVQAIDALPQTERKIARAHYLENATHDELVSRHGISYQSVSGRLFRAKRKLAKRLRHLLGGVLVLPATTLKKISSGGFTAMKIGTAPKITAGVIAIIALAFFGSRQLLSPEEDSTPSVEVAASTTNKLDQPVAGIDATRRNVVTTPSRADEPQMSAEEMGQIEDFFAQLDEADGQSKTGQLAEAEFQQDDDERVAVNTDVLTENTEQSAEEVMNAYLEALRNLDIDGMRSLMVGAAREDFEASVPMLSGELPEEILSIFDEVFDEIPEEVVELMLPMMREMMPQMLKQMFSQVEIVKSEYVGDEYHFRIRVPPSEIPVPGGFEIPEDLVVPDSVLKMRKKDGGWRIYEES